MASRRTNANSLAAAALVCALAFSRAAHADPESSARAEALFTEGVRLLERGEWAQACAKLSESHALDPAGGTAIDIGFCEEKRGNLASSLAAYEDALRRAIEEGRKDRETLARARIEELGKRVCRARVVLGSKIASVSGLTMAIDGTPIPIAAVDRPIPLDPGRRTFQLSAPGKRAATREIVISGEGTILDVAFDDLDDDGALSMQPPPLSAIALTPIDPDVEVRESARRRRTIGFALGGTGLALVTVGIVTGIAAANEHSESDRGCPGGLCTQDAVDAEDRANALAWASNIGFIAGGALVAVGAYLLVTGPSRGAPATVRPSARGLSVSF